MDTTTHSDKNRRTYERFDKQAKAFFYFHYDLNSKLDVQRVIEGTTDQIEKYPATSRNVSAQGLCFRSLHQLNQGNHLQLDMYLTGDKEPIHLEGEVCWCQAANSVSPQGFFDTGIRLLSINGLPVAETIHYDQTYHLIWSNVLDIIFGDIRKMSQKAKRE